MNNLELQNRVHNNFPLPTVNDAGEDALQTLVWRLSRLGYADFMSSFNPLSIQMQRIAYFLNDAPLSLRPLIRLFLLSESVECEILQPYIGDLVAKLVECGVLSLVDSDKVKTPNLVLLFVVGKWLFCQRQQVNPTLYFGDDSLALMLRLRPKRGGRCLDLCAGPGIQSLHCAAFVDSVVAVEINPVAASLATLNIVMNQYQNKIVVFCGDLYNAIPDHTYDTIVANPPLLPFPNDIRYPFVGHGGNDGLNVTRRILQGLPQALSANGMAQLIGATLSDGILPFFVDELRQWGRDSQMDIVLTITSHHLLQPGSVYFDGLVATATTTTELDYQSVSEAYSESLHAQGATHLCLYFLTVLRGDGKLSVIDVSRDTNLGLWYV